MTRYFVIILGILIMTATERALALPFWAQVPIVNNVHQNIEWETLPITSQSIPGVASETIYLAGTPQNFTHLYYWDNNKCLAHWLIPEFGATTQGDPLGNGCDPQAAGPVSALLQGNGRLDLFWFSFGISTTGHAVKVINHWWMPKPGGQVFRETIWTTQTEPVSKISVAAWDDGRIDLFWRDKGNQIRWYGFERAKKGQPGFTPNGWFSSEKVAASQVTGDPTVVERTQNFIDLFWRSDPNGTLMHEFSQDGGNSWTGAISMNVFAGSPPSATTPGANRIDVVYGVDLAHIGHLWIDGNSGSWTPQSEVLQGGNGSYVIASASRYRLGRMDVVAAGPYNIYGPAPANYTISRTLWQDSLPGFAGVSEGQSGGNGLWCWASAGASAVNYVYLQRTGKPSAVRSCDAANTELSRADCCLSPSPKACLVTGKVEPILSAYQVNFQVQNGPLPIDQLRQQLLYNHKVLISHHAHSDGSGHLVNLVDTYFLNGADRVVVFGTQYDGYWVDVYSDYTAFHDPSNGDWWVANTYFWIQ